MSRVAAVAALLAMAVALALTFAKGGGLILGVPVGMIVWLSVMEGRGWRRTGKSRRILYYLLVWVPIILSGRANAQGAIQQGWSAGDWLLALLVWGVGSVLWVALCAGVAVWVARIFGRRKRGSGDA